MNRSLERNERSMCLADMKKGDKCRITGFCKCCDRESVRRLLDYGFVAGRSLDVLEDSGDGNVTVDLDGCRLCVGGQLSSKINITQRSE